MPWGIMESGIPRCPARCRQSAGCRGCGAGGVSAAFSGRETLCRPGASAPLANPCDGQRRQDLTKSTWRKRRVPLDSVPEPVFEAPEQQELYREVLALPESYRTVLYLFTTRDIPQRKSGRFWGSAVGGHHTALPRQSLVEKTVDGGVVRWRCGSFIKGPFRRSILLRRSGGRRMRPSSGAGCPELVLTAAAAILLLAGLSTAAVASDLFGLRSWLLPEKISMGTMEEISSQADAISLSRLSGYAGGKGNGGVADLSGVL